MITYSIYLDIVVEHEILFAVALERGNGVLGLKVLELDEGPGPAQLNGRHELVNQRIVLLPV